MYNTLNRGLPFTCTETQLIEFFENCSVQSVHFCQGGDGRPTGEAFVELNSLRDAKEALKYDRKDLGRR